MQRHGRDVIEGADVAVPVPLHPRRRRHRGFNQAHDLARALGLPVERMLWRVRNTRSQTELPAGERRVNVRDAFACAGRHRLGPSPGPKGRSILLVDDVTTTGATLEACAHVLRQEGAREVRAVTAARVVNSEP
jgi:ComF family protein